MLSGAFWGAIAMGIVIESGKIVGVTYLYRNWKGRDWFRGPLLVMVLAAMTITSCGIYAYLAKASSTEVGRVANSQARLEVIDERVHRLHEAISLQRDIMIANSAEMNALDGQIRVLIEYNKINGPEGSRATRDAQQSDRDRLVESTEAASLKIEEYHSQVGILREEALEVSQVIRDFNVEIGAAISIAQLFGTDSDAALRYFFLVLMFTFDPLAIVLLMAANRSLSRDLTLPIDEEVQDAIASRIDDVFGGDTYLDIDEELEVANSEDSIREAGDTGVEEEVTADEDLEVIPAGPKSRAYADGRQRDGDWEA